MHIRPSPKTDVGPTCFRFPVLYGSFLTPAMSVHERRLSPVHTSNNVEATLSNVTRRTILSVCLFSFYLFNRLTVELDSCMYVCMGHDHSSPGTESQGQMSTRSVSPRSSTEDSFCSLNMRSTCLPFMLHREYEMTSPFSGAPRMPDRVQFPPRLATDNKQNLSRRSSKSWNVSCLPVFRWTAAVDFLIQTYSALHSMLK